MKTKAKLKKYYFDQVDSIVTLLSKSGHEFTNNDFHILRLCIKKIKAVQSFLSFYDPDFNQEKYFTPFTALFSHAGEVREIQVQQTLLKNYTSNPFLKNYFAYLTTNLHLHQIAFSELIDPKLLKKIKSNAKKVETFFQKSASQWMIQYLFDEENRIQLLLKADKLEKNQVHALRKQIKNIFYLQKIFQPKNKRLVIADEFQEMLGQWHDRRVIAKDILKAAQNHNLKPDEVKALMTLRKKILASADRQLAKIERTRKTV